MKINEFDHPDHGWKWRKCEIDWIEKKIREAVIAERLVGGDNARYKVMFEQAVSTLAAIDDALGIGDDGCGDPEQTLSAIDELKASATHACAPSMASIESAAHDAVIRALDEAGIRNDILRGMCIEVAIEKLRDSLMADSAKESQ